MEKTERKPQLFTVPSGTKPARCKTCHAEIYWTETKNGKRMPVDVAVPGGYPPDDLESPEDGSGLGYSHFATCESADQHRRPR